MVDGIKLIVGLGNPGREYDNTRHNVGFWLVSSLAEQHSLTLKLEPKFKGYGGNIVIANCNCRLLLPETFMNLSGHAVDKVARFYQIAAASILVVHDELDFTPGIVRLKRGGGANGHKGVENIAEQLGSREFWRMRIGIGRSGFGDSVSRYVLSSPSKAEKKEIFTAIGNALSIVPKLILGDFLTAMSELHA